jgi:hypothetical protein
MSKNYVMLIAVALSFPALADTVEEKINMAMSAAPAAVSAAATIKDDDGTLLRKGTNGYTCVPGNDPLLAGSPMCNDSVWEKMMEAVASKADFSTDQVGISYMLRGDVEAGSNDSPYATDKTKGTWIKEGPHVMIIVPKELLKGLSSDPASGAPYVMWKDTQYAHIMLPVGERK